MQTLQDKALGKRAPSFKRISGKATCCGCGSEAFTVVIYNDTTHDVVCRNGTCRQVWSPLGDATGTIYVISEAVGG